MQRGGEHVGAADVRHRERDRVHVVGRRLHPGHERVHARDHRRVGVPCALGVGRRTGGVVQPAGDALGTGRRREHRRITRRQRAAVEHGAPDLGGDLLGQPAVVEAAPFRSDDEVLGARLLGDVAHLALAHDGHDRVLHRSEPGERGQEHERVDRGGELPADDRPGPHSQVVQTGRDALGLVAVAGEGQLASVLVDEEPGVGRGRRALVDQSPVRRGVSRGLAAHQTLMIQPPSTLIVWPLIQSPAFEARRRMVPTRSSGGPSFLPGTPARIAARIGSSLPSDS